MKNVTIINNININNININQLNINQLNINNMGIELEKYAGAKTRFTCPKCGKNRCFTKYIDRETGEYIDNRVGICNHQVSCGYHLSPKMFFEMNPEKRKEINFNNIINMNTKKEIKRIKSIDNRFVIKSMANESALLEFFRTKFPEEDIKRVMRDYFVGGSKDGRVVFWQIDRQARVRSGKIMAYDPQTGKRKREDSVEFLEGGSRVRFTPPVDWVHTHMKKDGMLAKDWEMTQCLFGEHLINKYPEKIIAIVESEKTALIMSLFHPQINFMATGGLKNLNSQKIQSIKRAKILAFADFGCYEEWKQKAEEINSEIGSNILVSKVFEDIAKKMEIEDGLDVADLFLGFSDPEFAKRFITASNETQEENPKTQEEFLETQS